MVMLCGILRGKRKTLATIEILHLCNSITVPQMLCSIPTGKSGSKWLDRLRSSKGFPAGNDLDPEQFHHDPNLSNSPDSKLPDSNIGQKSEKPILNRNQTTETTGENGEKEWFGIMSNVIAELFNMGESDDLPIIHGKKRSRKQSKPKICVLSSSSHTETMPSSDKNSCVDIKQTSERLRLMKEENIDVEEEENYHADLSGFSRTQVTVIDSSYASWKCEKFLFRRKNVWRVREMKGRSVHAGVRKRKVNPLKEVSVCGEKKLKRCNLSKDTDLEARMLMPLDNVDLQGEEMDKGCKVTTDTVRFPRKSKNFGSSAVLIKSVFTSKKIGANIQELPDVKSANTRLGSCAI